MADVPEVRLADFPGLVNNLDPNDVPPGAGILQTNATCVKPGELQIRNGLRELTFEPEA